MVRSNTELKCDQCGVQFLRIPKDMYQSAKCKNIFCSRKCHYIYAKDFVQTTCGTCLAPIEVRSYALKHSKSGYCFCNRSCAVSYNNRLKRNGRRSKCEVRLFDKLVSEFPNLAIIPNDKTMLNGLEVDIAIPELKLGIEWNGIVHFKPIYGESQFNKIQSRDENKLKLANQLNINLIVIPDLVSTNQYVDECFIKVKQIINELLAGHEGI